MTIAVCPGSFDPVTNGHIDVITRCCRLFDEVHVVVAVNAMKKPLFTETERVDIIKHALADSGMTNYVVAWTDGLITDYCRKVDSPVIVKGCARTATMSELGMALVNRHLAYVETMFLPANPVLEHISSSVVKDVARHGGDITGMVPDYVVPLLEKALR